MHPHDIHHKSSLADQMFTEKERLDTTDRFLWHGGIQKCDIIANITKELCIVLDI